MYAVSFRLDSGKRRPPALHNPVGCTISTTRQFSWLGMGHKRCCWPSLMWVFCVERPKQPLIQRYPTDDVYQMYSFPKSEIQLSGHSTSRQTSCTYHPLAQWTVYYHVPCFLIDEENFKLLSRSNFWKMYSWYFIKPGMLSRLFLTAFCRYSVQVMHFMICFRTSNVRIYGRGFSIICFSNNCIFLYNSHFTNSYELSAS